MKVARAWRMTFTLAALAACAPSAMVNQQTEEQAIRALDREWSDAVAAHDIDRIAAMYTPDVVVTPSNMQPVAGEPALRKLFYDMLSLPGVVLTSTPGRIDVTSPTTATEVGTYSLVFDSPGGRVTDNGNYVALLRKIDGRWRIEREAVVSTVPMPVGEMIGADADAMEMRDNASLAWTDLTAPGFASGVRMATVHGNPAGNADYTIRLQFPDGYQIPVHWHPKSEHVTVLSGTLNLAMGKVRDDAQLRAYHAGAFVYMPGRTSHFATARGATTVQLHGIGPFQLNLGAAP